MNISSVRSMNREILATAIPSVRPKDQQMVNEG